MKLRCILQIALSLLFSQTISAQDCTGECREIGYRPFPYGFVQMQSGVGSLLTDVSFSKLLRPTYSVGIGQWFGPAAGLRFHVNGYSSKDGLDMNSGTRLYNFNYLNTNADLMINLANIASKRKNQFLNVYLIGGLGLNYAWNNSDFESIVEKGNVSNDVSNAWGKNTIREHLLGHNFRAGLMLDVNVSKHWNVGLEVDANALSDRFNSKFSSTDDWMITAQLGVTYKFGYKKPHAEIVEHIDRIEIDYNDNQQGEVVQISDETEVEADETIVEDVKLDEVIFYDVNKNEPNPDDVITKVANWAKTHQDKVIEISGYADVETGNSKINMQLSKNRAEAVAAALKAKVYWINRL